MDKPAGAVFSDGVLATSLRWILHVQLQGTSIPDTRQTVGTQLTQFQKHHKRQKSQTVNFYLASPNRSNLFF